MSLYKRLIDQMLFTEALGDKPESKLHKLMVAKDLERVDRSSYADGGPFYYRPKGSPAGTPSTHISTDLATIRAITDKERKHQEKTGRGSKPVKSINLQKAKPAPPASNPTAGIEVFKTPAAEAMMKKSDNPMVRSGDLAAFLSRPSAAAATRLVQKYDLSYGNGKVYTGEKKGRQYAFDVQNNKSKHPVARAMSQALTNILAKAGVDISTAEAGAVELAGEHFKPTRMYTRAERQILDVRATRVGDGIQIGNDKLHRFTGKEEKDYVAKWISAYHKQNPSATAEDAKDTEDMLHQIIQSHNDKLMKLSKLNGQEVVTLVSGQGLHTMKRKLTSTVNKLVETHGLSPEDAQVVNDSLSRLFASKTQTDYMQKAGSVMAALEKSGIRSGAAIIGESVAQGLFLMGGDTVYVPMNDTFELADLIAINPKGTDNPLDIINKIKFVQTVAHTSVKKDMGNASTTAPRIEQSTFYDDQHPNIFEDLTILTGRITDELWSPDKMQRTAAEGFVDQTLERYKESICAYYGIDPNIKTSKLRDALSRGLRPKCISGRVELPAGESFGAPIGQVDKRTGKPMNDRAWRNYSLAGYMMEAIHNKHVHRQNYTTLNVSSKGIKQSNGITSLTRVGFQFNKGKGTGKALGRERGAI